MARLDPKKSESPYEVAWRAKRLGVNKVCLGFSAGKDSLACWLALRDQKIEVVPLMFSLCPDLDIERRCIDYYEGFFNTKINTTIHPATMAVVYRCQFSDPYIISLVEALDLPRSYPAPSVIARRWIDKNISKDTLNVTGIKASDSIQRMFMIRRYGTVSVPQRRMFPVANTSDKYIYQMMIDHKCQLPSIYRDLNQSWDVPNIAVWKWLKATHPKDLATMLMYQPLAYETETRRIEVGR